MSEEIYYQEITNFEEYDQLEEIQQDAWKMPDRELVPKRLIYATLKSGGVVIGAYKGDKIIGYVWGWVGYKEPYGFFIYSHHNAVRNEYQNEGIGLRLKLEQRMWAIEKDYECINWTFDPLQSKNCYLNLHKLGVVCNTYYINYWGEMKDDLNIGMETDRLYCNWFLNSKHTKEYLMKKYTDFSKILQDEKNLILTTSNQDEFLNIKDINLKKSDHILAMEIPGNFINMSHKNKKNATNWRINTRNAFISYFKKGYKLIDFIIFKEDNYTRYFHVFKK